MFCPNCGKENDPSVRHCTSCGSFIPDFSADSDNSSAGDLNLSDVSEAPQPMSYQTMSQEEINEFQNDNSRYKEYTMSDVVAKKSKKKLIITLIVIACVIALGVASFFIIKSIMSGANIKNIQEDPTKYVFESYCAAAENMTNNHAALKAVSGTEQRTTKTTITGKDFSQTTIYSIDAAAMKFYALSEQSQTIPQEMKKYYSGPEKVRAELYTTLDKAVVNLEMDKDKYDYYLNLNNLREDAVSSIFGPKGENLFHLNEDTYNKIMDVYDFVYDNIKNNSDPFSLQLLLSKLKDDFDKCGNVNVAQENVEIDGSKTDAYVITHTFNSTDVVSKVFTDVKDWANDICSFNSDISTIVNQALDKIDVNQLISQINSSVQNFELTFKHYVNKDNAIMQTEIIANINGQGFKLTVTFGADPASSKKITLKAATVSSAAESVLQTIVIADESSAAEEKYTATYTGMLLSGSTVYTRNTSTGDFTFNNNMSNPMRSMAEQNGTVPPLSDNASPNISLSGNLQISDDSMTLTFTQPSYDGSEVKYEYYLSNKAEMNELSSNNDLLKAKSSDFQKLFPQNSLSSVF